MRVAGAAQDSGGTLAECLEGPAKPTGAFRVAASAVALDDGTPEDREAVETAWRELQARNSSYEFRYRFERRQKPMKVGQRPWERRPPMWISSKEGGGRAEAYN
jgi:hypothetical protein